MLAELAEAGMQEPTPLKPVFRWAGGKRALIKTLIEYVPPDIESCSYREPFLGAASLFLHLMPRRAVLSDLNDCLIQCYRKIRDEPELVWRYLKEHIRKDCDKHYYQVRAVYNQNNGSVSQAARFLYLNRTCFNGIFRVNTKNEFNVPYGYKMPPAFPTLGELRAVGSALRKATLRVASFENALSDVGINDFVYLDPPYPPLNGTSYFTHYTTNRFGEDSQQLLGETVRYLDKRGCRFLMTNADTKTIREIYSAFNMSVINVRRFVTCKNRKHQVKELVIRNY